MSSKNYALNSDDFTIDYHDEFYEYWLKTKGDCLLPASYDLNPNELNEHLDQISIFDYHEEEDEFSIRLMSRNCKELLLEQADTNNNMQNNSENFYDRLKWCIENKKPYFFINKIKLSTQANNNYSLSLYPFSENNKNVDMIILIARLE